MSLVVDLRLVDRAVSQTYDGDALPLPPAPRAIAAPQPPQLTDRPPGRDSLDGADRTDDVEAHALT
jgi:hypothetical protein